MKTLSQFIFALLACPVMLGAEPALKDVFKNDFLIGAALNPSQFCESNALAAALIKRQFNTVTPENVLKWEHVHPEPGRFDFKLADDYVDFGRKNGMAIIGHTLVWHSQTPAWVFEEQPGQAVSREVLLRRMQEHISTVVGRYQGRIKGWDVVNEAVDEDGSLRQSPWLKIAGEDFLVKAYQFAHAADPLAELYYNDYGLENSKKRAGAIALIRKLQAAGVKLAAVGLQGHYKLDANFPTARQVDKAIADFAKLGVKVMITELDVDVLPAARQSLSADVSTSYQAERRLDPFPQELPSVMQAKLAARYAEIFTVFLKHRHEISRVTFWGVSDGDSWLNDWPVPGRTSYPLLFDRAGKPKLAFEQIIALVPPRRVSQRDGGGTKPVSQPEL